MPGECLMSAVPEKKTNLRRFSDVEEVSDDIFGKVLPFPSNEELEPEELAGAEADDGQTSRFQDLTDYLSGAFARCVVSDASLFKDSTDTKKRLISFASENDLDPDCDEATLEKSGRQKRKGHDGLTRYLTLPNGVELLEIEPKDYDDQATMAAIRKVMVDQKREFSRRILPELHPEDAIESAGQKMGDIAGNVTGGFMFFNQSSRIAPFHRAALQLAARILAWFALGMAVMVNPSFFQHLALAFVIVATILAVLFALVLFLESSTNLVRLVLTKVRAVRFRHRLISFFRVAYGPG